MGIGGLICHGIGAGFVRRSCGFHSKLPALNKPSPTPCQIRSNSQPMNSTKQAELCGILNAGDRACASVLHSFPPLPIGTQLARQSNPKLTPTPNQYTLNPKPKLRPNHTYKSLANCAQLSRTVWYCRRSIHLHLLIPNPKRNLHQSLTQSKIQTNHPYNTLPNFPSFDLALTLNSPSYFIAASFAASKWIMSHTLSTKNRQQVRRLSKQQKLNKTAQL